MQQQFATKVAGIVNKDPSVIGLAAAGSWITNELDEYSDLDLILVTKEKISADKSKMLAYAGKFGDLLSAFTGEHVGEPRVLICLYDNPLLHVDIKFLTLPELNPRIETPVILFDHDAQLKNAFESADAKFPYPDYQWLEDRFWMWIHYALLKIGRGEYFETLDFFAALRSIVLGPLLQIKYGKLPRGVRKIEKTIDAHDLKTLLLTTAGHSKPLLIDALKNCIGLYRSLRSDLYDDNIVLQAKTEKRVLEFMEEIDNKDS